MLINLLTTVRQLTSTRFAQTKMKMLPIVRQAGATCGVHVVLAIRRILTTLERHGWQTDKSLTAILSAQDGRAGQPITQHLYDDRQRQVRRMQDEWIQLLQPLADARLRELESRAAARGSAAAPAPAVAVSTPGSVSAP